MTPPPTLLIDRGDLPSLVALAMEHDPSNVILWHPREPDPARKRRLAAVKEHGAAYSVKRIMVQTGSADPGSDDAQELLINGLQRDIQLMCVVMSALEVRASRIIWPIQTGPDIAQMAREVDRANLVCDLATLGASNRAITIDLPVVDLTDKQMADLADDMSVPAHGFWPCLTGKPEPCETCDGCRQWLKAFADADVPNPWAAVPA